MEKILTGNHRLLKNLNSNVILNLVRTNTPIFGDRLAKITGMRPSTVQNMVVIGGEISNAKKFILEPIQQAISNGSLLGVERKFRLVESSLPSYSVALGAATVILQKICQGPIIKTIVLGEG